MAQAKIGNYSSCCRLCLSEKNNYLNNIYAGYTESHGLVDKIGTLVGVQITQTDKLSTMLCDKCYLTINNFAEFKKACHSNQGKLQKWMTTINDNITNGTIKIKDEPVDEPKDDEVSAVGKPENMRVVVKSEPAEPMEEEFFDYPPALTPHPPEIVMDVDNDSQLEEAESTIDVSKDASINKSVGVTNQCSVCEKILSNPGNRKKHEKTMHGLHGGKLRKVESNAPVKVVAEPKKSTGSSFLNNKEVTLTRINKESKEVAIPRPTTPSILDKDHEKIKFAAGLRLQSKSAPRQMQSSLTKIEKTYLEKCRIMISMFQKDTCACHNQYFSTQKRMLGHLRQLFVWFPPYTCYNCLLTFDGRSGKMRHILRCPRVELESLIRLSELRARTKDKIRLYQNFKCIQCNYLFSFYEDYCSHVDNTHVTEDGPFDCLCMQSFENADLFRQHIHKSCFLNYYCDICFLLTSNLQEFVEHCEEFHDTDENYVFLKPHANFRVLTNIEINNCLLESKKRLLEKEASEMEEPDEMQMDINVEMPNIDPLIELDEKHFSRFNSAKCPRCNKVYANYHNMVRHLKSHHRFDLMQKRTECEICGNVFSNYSNMMRHKKAHCDALKCSECLEVFTSVALLKTHQSQAHADTVKVARTTYRCEECGESFKSARWLEQHQENEHGFACEQCDKVLKTVSDYEQHRNTHLNITLARDPKTKSYHRLSKICKICDKGFNTESELEEHLQLHERMPVLEAEDDESIEDDKKHSCNECGRHYQSSRGLWVHNKKYHPDKKGKMDFPRPCDECDRVIYSLSGWVMHKQMHDRTNKLQKSIKTQPANPNDDSDYSTCKKCFKVFANRSTLKTHMKCHGINTSPTRTQMKTGKFMKTIWCDICHQACQGVDELKKHKLEHESEDLTEPEEGEIATKPVLKPGKQHDCKLCKLSFDTSNQWNDHMFNDHSENNTPKFECDTCGKVFNSNLALNVHYSWHKRAQRKAAAAATATPQHKTQMFKCISCAKQFEDDTALQLHIFECHRKTSTTIERRIFKCEPCDLSFTVQSEYDAHERTHEKVKDKKAGVTCKFCDKTFSRSDYLNIHITSKHPQHAVAGQFKCTQCERIFEKQNALTIHLKVHEKMNVTVSKPTKAHKYSCSICHVGFDVPKELRNHIIALHPF
ncbi:PREDICTED: zinc finger protein 62 homolog isoform X1 [Nicrophorus vespilloides]|uniref:Zinc finger protein 62 homolog isoform X1 n=1 Tax=Nicrophorus vespilloides TaxID=110193 RepID=A0ABM1MUR0_NICVS|nr:PREDICTED: zinc finger protein 62 homolog isoform X1 [Nicrophorus vespilloides]